jgi:hypothetical protein
LSEGLSGRVAIIGWGSLIWDLDDLAPKVDGPWWMEAGPPLPLEFSRISPKRLMSLVVVIDPEHGEPCPTHAIASLRDEPALAAVDLAARERAPLARIGVHDAETGTSRASDPRMARAVADWCAATGARGAVWTDLPRNFAETTGRPFSVPAGLRYLETLRGPAAAEARRYIGGAPATTDTPLRRALARAPWWRVR